MKVMYPALFEKEDSRYNVTFPDLPEADHMWRHIRAGD